MKRLLILGVGAQGSTVAKRMNEEPNVSEIKEILDEGLESEEGAFLIRVDGKKDGKRTRIDNYVNAPGVFDAFEKAGLTAETYLTGQCGALFTKMNS
jgi:hypothetical protein